MAGIIIEGGKFLVARRLPGGDLGEKWEFPGGKVEEGESDGEALVREFAEEFSVAVKAGPLLAEGSFEHRGTLRCLRAYRVYPLSREFRLTEHSLWRWADPAEIGGLDFAPSDLKLLPALRAAVNPGDPEGRPQMGPVSTAP